VEFRTEIFPKEQPGKIGYDSKIFSLGSCFAVNMSEKFEYFKFHSRVNPFGIIFNPISLEKLIRNSLSGREFSEENLYFHNERWHCFDVHSDMSGADPEKVVWHLNAALAKTRESLLSASHIIITLGTAWVYRKKSGGAIVANCHKVPQTEFQKELLSVSIIRESVGRINKMIREVNSQAKIILTVSPVRHIKDGVVESQRSKANLLAGLHEALDEGGACYFPSYEIMMDDLRDYRFYAADMIHPNSVAIDYIWDKFVGAWISEEAKVLMLKVDAVRKALAHRSFNPGSEAHRKFLENLRSKVDELRMAGVEIELP